MAELPASVSRLTDLKALSLAANKLTALPEGLGACAGLRLLDVSHNALKALPQVCAGARAGGARGLAAAGSAMGAAPASMAACTRGGGLPLHLWHRLAPETAAWGYIRYCAPLWG